MKKLIDVITIWENLLQQKQANIQRVAIHYSYTVHSIVVEAIFTEMLAECMIKFYADLRQHATGIINYEKKEMLPLTGRLNHTIIKNSATSAKRSFIMLMMITVTIVMMIA